MICAQGGYLNLKLPSCITDRPLRAKVQPEFCSTLRFNSHSLLLSQEQIAA